jgi:hypothetical protein
MPFRDTHRVEHTTTNTPAIFEDLPVIRAVVGAFKFGLMLVAAAFLLMLIALR